jgi:hypothetical protein
MSLWFLQALKTAISSLVVAPEKKIKRGDLAGEIGCLRIWHGEVGRSLLSTREAR